MPYESTNLNNFKNSQNEFKLSLMKKKKQRNKELDSIFVDLIMDFGLK